MLNLIYKYLLFLNRLIFNNMKLLLVFFHLLLFIFLWIFILLIFSLPQIRVNNIFVRPFPGDVWVCLPRHDNIIANQKTCFIHVRIRSVFCLILDNYSTLCCIETWTFVERNRCFSCWVRLWLIVIVLTVFFYPETGVDMIFLKYYCSYIFISHDHFLAIVTSFRSCLSDLTVRNIWRPGMRYYAISFSVLIHY